MDILFATREFIGRLIIANKHLGFSLMACFLTSCVVMPKEVIYYDKECEIVSKKLELTVEEFSAFNEINSCTNEECLYEVLTMALGESLVFSVSGVVSGSMVMAGNTLYWLEKQGSCTKVSEG